MLVHSSAMHSAQEGRRVWLPGVHMKSQVVLLSLSPWLGWGKGGES